MLKDDKRYLELLRTGGPLSFDEQREGWHKCLFAIGTDLVQAADYVCRCGFSKTDFVMVIR